MKKYSIIGLFSTLILILIDQYTKSLAVAHLQAGSIPIIDGVFRLQYLENRGAAFGILQNRLGFFLFTTTIILAVSLYLYWKLPTTKRFFLLRSCLILIMAGGIGNMIDRVRLNYVIDFFYFELINFPIFNVADIYVTVAMFLLILLILFYYTEEELKVLWTLKNKESLTCKQ